MKQCTMLRGDAQCTAMVPDEDAICAPCAKELEAEMDRLARQMGATTNIEWTDSTWNPLRGCSRVSEGCRNCYAEKVAYRFSGPGQAYEGLAVLRNGHASWTGKVSFAEKHLLDPLKWKDPRRIFVNSMSDLFHENVPYEWIDRIFAVMALCPQHTFQVLTKRPERMLRYLSQPDLAGQLMDCQVDMADWNHSPKEMSTAVDRALRKVGRKENCGESPWTGKDSYCWMPKINKWPLPNVWLGVSVENQKAADERIPLLLQTPAAVRFLSCEPLLGPVSLRWKNSTPFGVTHPRHLRPEPDGQGRVCTDEYDGLRELDWAIVGGESGPSARPMHPDWARSLRDQCQTARVPFFFKQWGEFGPCENGEVTPNPEDWDNPPLSHEFADPSKPRSGWEKVYRVGKKAAGALLDGREWREFPEVQHAQ